MWDAGTGARLAAYERHRSFVYCAAFSPDGARVVTGSADATSCIWRCFRNVADATTYVSSLLTRSLTTRQRRENHLLSLDVDVPADLDAIPPPPHRVGLPIVAPPVASEH